MVLVGITKTRTEDSFAWMFRMMFPGGRYSNVGGVPITVGGVPMTVPLTYTVALPMYMLPISASVI